LVSSRGKDKKKIMEELSRDHKEMILGAWGRHWRGLAMDRERQVEKLG